MVELNDHFEMEGVQGVTLWLNACYKQIISFEFFLRGEFPFFVTNARANCFYGICYAETFATVRSVILRF